MRVSTFVLLAAALFAFAVPSEAGARERICPLPGVQQLRIYEIFERNKPAFHARFRDHAWRIMKRYGFDILAFWETKQGDRTEFAYLLQWPDKEVMQRSWAAFMADEEWSRIKRETGAIHGQLVGEIEDRTLRRTDYSPC